MFAHPVPPLPTGRMPVTSLARLMSGRREDAGRRLQETRERGGERAEIGSAREGSDRGGGVDATVRPLVRVVLVGAFGERGGRGARDHRGHAAVREVEVGASLAERIGRRTRKRTRKEIGAVVFVRRSLRERVGRSCGNYRGDAVAVEIEIGAFGDIVRRFLREPVVGGRGCPAGLRGFPIVSARSRPTQLGGVPVISRRGGEGAISGAAARDACAVDREEPVARLKALAGAGEIAVPHEIEGGVGMPPLNVEVAKPETVRLVVDALVEKSEVAVKAVLLAYGKIEASDEVAAYREARTSPATESFMDGEVVPMPREPLM